VALVLLVVIGCGVPERPKVVTISKTSAFRPSTPKEVRTLEQAMAAIITVCRDDLGLSVVDPLTVYLYRNTASFAFYGYGWGTLPIDVGNAIAFARRDTIHINLEAVQGREWGEVVMLLAHEYAHNIDNSTASHVTRIEQWIVEGFADWVAVKVVHALGWREYEISLHAAKQELIRHRDLLPNLSWLNLNQDWQTFSQKPKGWIRTYGQAFVAMHRVIEGKGLKAVINYLKSANFEASFGVSKDAFRSEIEKFLSAVTSETRLPFVMDKPNWKVGDQWVYEEKRAGERKKLRRRVVKEDSYQGLSAFVVESDEEEFLYVKDTLGLMGTRKEGKLIVRRDNPLQYFSWPLVNGTEWRNRHTLENLEKRSTRIVDLLVVVANNETVSVPAGTFEAAKIETYDYETGRLESEYWYSPNVKWFIKLRFYEGSELAERQLVTFKIN
jgi:hypothetical protein